ncbi:MAG TPA: elongation factor Ts [Candidatus Limnocylindria bacterium]|nr:elongation factor Ts [Candidatus Limnocylindria bacterium]
MASATDVQRLRSETGAGVMDSKKALEAAKGDFEKAKTILKEKGLASAAKRGDRETREGVVEAYIHSGGRIGALVELSSETDFVARNPEFRALARAIAMQVAAMRPKHVSWELLKDDEIKALLEEHGDEKTAKAAAVLMHQPYIKDQGKTIGDLVTQLAAATGENIKIRRIARFELGEAA